MKRASTKGRLQRLEFITTRLKSGEALIMSQIADEIGVSVRTLSRDIQILRDQGLPIEADRGRGGGIRLHWRWGIGRVNLNYSEAIALLVSLAVAEQMKSPLLMANLGSVRRKLTASFSPSMKHKVNQLKSRILIEESASPFVLSTFSTPRAGVVEKLHQAFLLMSRMTIHYCSENGSKTKRTIEPHYLLLSYPVWYVLAWDHLRGDIRTFRCDRIESLHVLDDGFYLRKLVQFKQAMEGVEAIHP